MIRYFKCVVCGKRGMDQSSTQNKKFCSRQCADTYYRRKKGVGLKKEGRVYCRFNEGVECYKHDCVGCGWNPAVAKNRLEAVVNG